MIIITKTPLRISLGGGGTDLPFYADAFGGSMVTGAIDKYIYVTISERAQSDYKLHVDVAQNAFEVDEIQHELTKQALKFLSIGPGIEIHSTAQIDGGTGLGSSSTYLVGLLHALYSYKGKKVSAYQLAEDSSHIMMNVLKGSLGKQDQYAAAFGGILHIAIATNGKVQASPVNISESTLLRLQQNTMLFSTGIRRSADVLLREQKDKAKEESKNQNQDNNSMFEYYHTIKKIGEESRISLELGNVAHFGKLLHKHWEKKKSISTNMSSSAIDDCYRLAIQNGALGGKIIGAGGGGFLMIYTEKNHEQIKSLLKENGLTLTPFAFEFNGSQVIFRE